MTRHVPCPAGEERQPVLEPGEQLARLQHLDAGGGELDREWQPVEPLADLRDLAVRCEARTNGFARSQKS